MAILTITGIILSVIISVVSLALFYWQTSKTRRTLDQIPGPPALPILGNALQLTVAGHDFFEKILWFCRKYASTTGILRFWLGPHPAVAVTKADTVEVLLNSSKHITKSKEYNFLKPWLGTGLLTSTGAKWKGRRRMLTPTFHFRILTDFQNVFNEQASILVKRLEEKARTKEKFNIFPYVTLCTLDVICDTAMGKNVKAQSSSESDYVKAVYSMGEILQSRMKTPWLGPDFIFYNTKAGRDHQKYLGILHNFTRQVIQERSNDLDDQLQSHTGKVSMEDLQTDKPFLIGKQKRLAFLDMLLIAAKGGADLDHSDIQEEVDTFMFEGHDTTAAAGNWAVYLLGAHPDVQTLAQQEQDEIFGDDDRAATMDDIKKMKYLGRVLKETLRVFPSVPMFAREIEEDCVIGGFQVPKGASGMIIVSQLHKDPVHFPDPEKFDPDRWLPSSSAKRHPYCYVPFSAGSRNCIGQKFAVNEEKVILSALLRHYNITSHQKREELKPVGELIQRPEKGIFVTISKRNK